MELHNLSPAKGSTKNKKRIGRGQGSGHGGTSTRGHKGAKSRSGFKNKRHFEGGQTPMQRRLPKRGFKNFNRVDYVAFNLGAIQKFVSEKGVSDFSLDNLMNLGVIKKTDKVKVLANGTLTSTVNITAHAISAKAKEAIEAQGGSVTLV